MNLKLFQIINAQVIELAVQAKTLDEMTRALPQGFYTTFSTTAHGTRVMGLRKHLERLYEPAKQINLAVPASEEMLRGQIALLAKENLPHESRIRLILTKDSGDLYIGVQSFTPLPEMVYAKGVNVVTASAARHNPKIKDTGFISESAAQRQLLSAETFEVLLTQNGRILEGMTSNFYILRDGVMVTAGRGILPGVTRKTVLRITKGEGISIQYRAPRVNEQFDEAFLTSSSRGIVPIVSIDGKTVGNGKVGRWTKILIKKYRAYIEERSETIRDSSI